MKYWVPNVIQLQKCCALMASNHGLEELTEEVFIQVTYGVLVADPTEGGKDALGCLVEGLISEVELRNLYMTHIWDALTQYGAEERKFIRSEKLDTAFDQALYSRTATDFSRGFKC